MYVGSQIRLNLSWREGKLAVFTKVWTTLKMVEELLVMGTSTSGIPGRLGPLRVRLSRGPLTTSVGASHKWSSVPGAGISRSVHLWLSIRLIEISNYHFNLLVFLYLPVPLKSWCIIFLSSFLITSYFQTFPIILLKLNFTHKLLSNHK